MISQKNAKKSGPDADSPYIPIIGKKFFCGWCILCLPFFILNLVEIAVDEFAWCLDNFVDSYLKLKGLEDFSLYIFFFSLESFAKCTHCVYFFGWMFYRFFIGLVFFQLIHISPFSIGITMPRIKTRSYTKSRQKKLREIVRKSSSKLLRQKKTSEVGGPCLLTRGRSKTPRKHRNPFWTEENGEPQFLYV